MQNNRSLNGKDDVSVSLLYNDTHTDIYIQSIYVQI